MSINPPPFLHITEGFTLAVAATRSSIQIRKTTHIALSECPCRGNSNMQLHRRGGRGVLGGSFSLRMFDDGFSAHIYIP